MRNRFYYFVLLILSIIAYSCEERERNNIFDPANKNKSIDIGLSLSSTDSTIRISWNSPANIKYTSINIFRKTEGEKVARLYATVEKDITLYIDNNIEFDKEYSYYLTINGETEESYPTETETIIPGPYSIWILDTFLAEINKLNYDLSSSIVRKNAFWPPKNMAIAKSLNLALVTYPRFRDMEIFDMTNGEFIAGNRNIERPYDAVYDSGNNKFWLVDSSGSLYTINPDDASEQLVSRSFIKPIQIELFDQNLFIMDQGLHKIFIYDNSSQVQDSIFKTPDDSSFTHLRQFRLDKTNNNIYILDGEARNNTLYKYNMLSKEITNIFQDSIIYSFDVNSVDETIWIIIAKRLNSNLVQLSGETTRHFISDLEKPVDIKVNSINGNFVITDFKFKVNIKVPKVFHYRSDLTKIGTFSTYGDPSRIYIE
ncbi:MAG: hypothetical protein D8M58_02870 [Calditrichaeota bacterium]|nr:MAG: hypothetical protein DWQ03_04210 [Calditrichota bacterium]MBL1204307.1 hypothetical protein [Calditrichota bacterium]NOG44137.1 hypothetical protein [Calditrichota bacterium]